MLIHILKSKIHRARVTGGNVDYEGSLGIARDLKSWKPRVIVLGEDNTVVS